MEADFLREARDIRNLQDGFMRRGEELGIHTTWVVNSVGIGDRVPQGP